MNIDTYTENSNLSNIVCHNKGYITHVIRGNDVTMLLSITVSVT